MRRTLCVMFLGLALAACGPKAPVDEDYGDDSDWFKDPPGDEPPPPPAVPVICGEIRLSAAIAAAKPEEVASWVFLFARRSPDSEGAFAAMKMKLGPFPMRFCLSDKNVLVRGAPFSGAFYVNARIDTDGMPPLEPGDFDGTTRAPVPVGTRNLLITIDTFR